LLARGCLLQILGGDVAGVVLEADEGSQVRVLVPVTLPHPACAEARLRSLDAGVAQR
jgi:hypothetical protein